MEFTREELDATREKLMLEVNSQHLERKELEEKYGKVWDTNELRNEFHVKGFQAPFVAVVRRLNNRLGTLMFQHHPRYYFRFVEDGK